MKRLRWVGYSMAIFAILAVITVTVSTRRAPGSTTSHVAAGDAEAWVPYVASVDRALDARDIGRASRQWRDAYGVALRSQRCEAMLAAGEAALRIRRASSAMGGFDAEARQCFLIALFRARAERSVDGVMRAAEAFRQLGDTAVVEGALRMAHSFGPAE